MYLFESPNSTITNNEISIYGMNGAGYGMSISGSANSTITDNNITTTGTDAFGMGVSDSSNSKITDNNITTTGSDAFGMLLADSSNSTITDNNITSNFSAVKIDDTAENNIFLNNKLTATTSNLIYDKTSYSYNNYLIYNFYHMKIIIVNIIYSIKPN